MSVGCGQDVYGVRSVPQRGDLRCDDRGLLEPGEDEWDAVQRRERVHGVGYLPDRDVSGGHGEDVYGVGSMPQRGELRLVERDLLGSCQDRWHFVH
jgi:hypothetical protein